VFKDFSILKQITGSIDSIVIDQLKQQKHEGSGKAIASIQTEVKEDLIAPRLVTYGEDYLMYVDRGRPAWTKNCLLYTSPSPRDRTRSRMPSSA